MVTPNDLPDQFLGSKSCSFDRSTTPQNRVLPFSPHSHDDLDLGVFLVDFKAATSTSFEGLLSDHASPSISPLTLGNGKLQLPSDQILSLDEGQTYPNVTIGSQLSTFRIDLLSYFVKWLDTKGEEIQECVTKYFQDTVGTLTRSK